MPQSRCPACGEPIYGWIKLGAADRRVAATYVVDRCEECGLGVTRELAGEAGGGNGRAAVTLPDLPGSTDPDATLERARSGLRTGGPVELRAPNVRSVQAGVGGDRWGALELPGQRLHLTPRSLELLLERHGLVATRIRQPLLGRNHLWMWQTLMNGFTFHRNFARDAWARRLTPGTARSHLGFAIDAVVSVLAALPIALISVPLELGAALARRGGEIVATVAPAGSEPARAPLYDRASGG